MKMKKSNITKIALLSILIEPMFAGPAQSTQRMKSSSVAPHTKSRVLPMVSNIGLKNSQFDPSRFDPMGGILKFNPLYSPDSEMPGSSGHIFPSTVGAQDTGSHTMKKREREHSINQTSQRNSVSTPPGKVNSKKKVSKKKTSKMKTVQSAPASAAASAAGVSLAIAGFASNNGVLVRNPLSEQLREDSQKTHEKLEQFISTSIPTVSKTELINRAKKLESSAVDLIDPNNADYTKSIDMLIVARDAYNGIEQKIVKGEDGSSVRIRDARNPDVRNEENPRTAYGAQYINQVRATEQLIISEGQRAGRNSNDIRESVQAIRILARSDLQNILDSENAKEIIVDVNTKLTKLAIDMGVKNPVKKIGWAKDFMNLEDEHHHTATVYTMEDHEGKKHTVIESDVKMSGLTQDQIGRYGKITNHRNLKDAVKNNKGDKSMDWFTKASPDEQYFIHKYAGTIALGEHVLPTQLRGQTIGLRNSYFKETYMVAADNTLVPVMQIMHSGTISFHGKGNTQTVANLNARQLKEFAGDRNVNANVLNSPLNPTGNDGAIHKQVGKAQKEGHLGDGGTRTTSPFNAFRKAPLGLGKDFSGANAILVETAKISTEIGLAGVTRYLEGRGGTSQEATAELKSKGLDSNIQRNLQRAITTRELINNSSEGRGLTRNKSLDISVNMQILAHSLHDKNGILKKEADRVGVIGLDVTCQNASCQSGKDRTGLAVNESSRQATFETLNLDYKANFKALNESDVERKNFQGMIDAGHTAYMAGVQGGSIGAFGIKSDTTPAFGKLYDGTSQLSQDTASFNKFKVHKKEIKKYTEEAKKEIKEAKKESKLFAKLMKKKEKKVLKKFEKEIKAKLKNKNKESSQVDTKNQVDTKEKLTQISLLDYHSDKNTLRAYLEDLNVNDINDNTYILNSGSDNGFNLDGERSSTPFLHTRFENAGYEEITFLLNNISPKVLRQIVKLETRENQRNPDILTMGEILEGRINKFEGLTSSQASILQESLHFKSILRE